LLLRPPGQVAFAAWLRRHACDPAHCRTS
jgi:hypothetical protein